MNLPNIPSDNIYKFITLSSLVIMVIANIYFFTEIRNIYEDLINVDIDIVKLKYDVNVMDVELNNWYRGMENKLKKFIDTEKLELIDTSFSKVDRISYLIDLTDSLESNQKDKVEPILDKFGEEAIKYYKITSEILIKNDILEINNEKISVYYSAIKRLKIIYFILTPVLSILLVYGFRNWYVKVQKYQDVVLKKQAEKIISENKQE
jgi:hypothetical protein